MHQTKYKGIIIEGRIIDVSSLGSGGFLHWLNLLYSLSVHLVVIYVLAGWEAPGYTCISR
mgnify:CR=1 FL=1